MRSRNKRQQRLVVVRAHPLRGWGALAAGVVAVLLAGAGGYWWGWHAGAGFESTAAKELKRLHSKIDADGKAMAELRQQVANARAAASLDRTAAEEVRTNLMKQKDRLTTLQEQIRFYRSLMAPGAQHEGLSVRGLNIWRTDDPKRFRFKLVVQQVADKHPLLSGQLNFEIKGEVGGHAKTLALKDVCDDYDSRDIKLRFKYFQNIEGVMQLPAGFEPRSVHVVARANHGHEVDRKFDWQVGS